MLDGHEGSIVSMENQLTTSTPLSICIYRFSSWVIFLRLLGTTDTWSMAGHAHWRYARVWVRSTADRSPDHYLARGHALSRVCTHRGQDISRSFSGE